MATETDQYKVDTGRSADDVRDVEKAFRDNTKAMEGAKAIGNELSEELEGMAKSFVATHLSIQAATGAIKAVGEWALDGAKAFLEQEAASLKLDAALGMVGGNALRHKNDMVAFAESVEAVTGKSAESTEALQAMLVQYGVAPGLVNRMTEAAMRLAAATGQDATAAARLLAQANAQGRDELKRYAVEVDDAAFKAKGFAAVLEEVERKFPPITATVPEQTQQLNALSKAWEDVGKAVGETLVHFSTESGWAKWLTDSLNGVTLGIQVVSASLKETALGIIALSSAASNAAMLNYAGAAYDASDAVSHFGKAAAEASKTINDKLSPAVGGLLDHSSTDVLDLPAMHFKLPSEAEIKAAAEAAKKAREEAEKLFTNSPTNLLAQERRDEAKAADQARKDEQAKILEQGDWEVAQAQYVADQKKLIAEDFKAEMEQVTADAEQRLQLELSWKQTFANIRQSFEQWGQTLTQGVGNYLAQMLTENVRFTDAMREQSIKRATAGKTETEATAIRAKMEKEFADDRAAAFLKMTADMLAQIAVQAGIKAIWEGGEGVAALARQDYASAGQHFTAAGIYAGVAIAAGGTSAAISATRPMTAEEDAALRDDGASGSTEGVGDTAGGTTARLDNAARVNVYNLGITGQSQEAQGFELQRITAQYSDLETGTR